MKKLEQRLCFLTDCSDLMQITKIFFSAYFKYSKQFNISNANELNILGFKIKNTINSIFSETNYDEIRNKLIENNFKFVEDKFNSYICFCFIVDERVFNNEKFYNEDEFNNKKYVIHSSPYTISSTDYWSNKKKKEEIWNKEFGVENKKIKDFLFSEMFELIIW